MLECSIGIKQYAIFYGGISSVKNVEMLDLNSKRMKLNVDGNIIIIAFDHELEDSSDAHETLVSMIKSLPDWIIIILILLFYLAYVD